jgi:type II secretory pathway pseudopilin PulG
MRPSSHEDECPTPFPAGFSIIEAVMVLLVVATILAALTPGVIRIMEHARVNRAANVVAAQFYVAQSLAGRQRKPVLLTVSPSAKTITIRDAGTAATRLAIRYFGSNSDFKLRSLTATPASVYILPNGMASTSMIVDVGDASYKQQVRMTKAGQIRILR